MRHHILTCSALAALLAGLDFSSAGQEQKAVTLQEQFEARYKAWIQRVERGPYSPAGDFPTERVFGNKEFGEIVALGPKALPFIIAGIRTYPHVAEAASRIAKWEFYFVTGTSARPSRKQVIYVLEFPDIKSTSGIPSASEIWLRWWRDNPKWTADRFSKHYAEWQLLTGEGKDKEAEAEYQAIKDLGIAALPFMMERVKQGDRRLMPAISYLTDSAVPADWEPVVALEWWEKNKEQWTIPFGPLPPEPPQGGESKEKKGPVPAKAGVSAKPEPEAAAPEEGPVAPEVKEARRIEQAELRRAAEEARRKAEKAKSQPATTTPAQAAPEAAKQAAQ
jgi:hypothetical protein